MVPTHNRIIFYWQTLFDSNGNVYSLAPVWNAVDPVTHKPYTTTIHLSAFHFGYNSDGSPYIHLNDHDPSDPMFALVWQQLAASQSLGISVSMMLGGAGGAYTDLFDDYDMFFPLLLATLQKYSLDGIDLDIEEQVTLQNTEMLINDLASEYPSGFITMAPVATELHGERGPSGLNYQQLYADVGSKIAWFNGQFYNGWGSVATPDDYEKSITQGGFPAEKVVLGMLGNPADGGSGYYDTNVTGATVATLERAYPMFGGVFSWELYNTLPTPSQWITTMARSMGLVLAPGAGVTRTPPIAQPRSRT